MEQQNNNVTQPTETQVKVLMSDWLGNLRMKDEGNYTHAGKGGIKRTKLSDTTDFLVGNVSGLGSLELLKHARGAASQVVNAVVSEPVDVFIGGSTSLQGEVEGRKVINLATDFFDDGSLKPKQKVAIMLGLASHEAAHAVYTDSSLAPKELEKEKGVMKDLKHHIWNIIEDERIEYLLGDDRPGFAETLGSAKEYFFKKVVNDMRTNGEMPTEPLPKLLSALTQAVRYPSEMSRDEVVENFDQLDEIRKVLSPYPLTAQGAWKAANKVMSIVRRIAEEEIEKQQQQQEQQQGGGGGASQPQPGQQPQPQPQSGDQNQDQDKDQDQGNPNQGGQDQQKQDPSSGNGGQEPEKPDQNQSGDPQDGGNKKDDQQQSKQQEPKKKPSEKEIREAIEKALSTEQGKNVMKALEKDEKKSEGKNSAVSIQHDPNAQRFVNEDSAERTSGGPGEPKAFVFKPKGSPESYNKALKAVRKFIPAMSKALSCKSRDSHYVLHGLPSGKLNTNKLVALKSGNTAIFDKKGSVTCSSASVCMLIDESGSMSGLKLERAREAAVLVNEAIARIKNVHFYCYGYTSSRITVFSENGKTSKWALGDTQAVAGTPTGFAMKTAAQRVRRFTHDPVLMLVLTDGASDNNALVERQDRLLAKDGFTVIGVGIQCSYVQSSFRESVTVMDISTFAVELGKLTKGKLDKMLVRHDA